MSRIQLFAFLCSAIAISTTAQAEWPQFRGPSGQGVVAEAKLPASFSPTENVTWHVDLPGKAWSSPVVRKDQIWVTTAVESPPTAEQSQAALKKSGLNEKQFRQRQVAGTISLRTICVEFTTGKIQHDIELFQNESPDAIHTLNSFASPTPVIDGDRLYCHFGTNGTACLDANSGEVLWKRTIPLFHSVGAGSSPLIYQDLIVLVCDGVDDQFVLALNKQTGKEVWKTKRPPFRTDDGEHKKAYSTPLKISYKGQDQLVIPGAQWCVAYEPLTGEEIWKVDHGKGFSTVPAPVYADGVVYICTGFSSSELWAIKVDGHGDVSDTHVIWTATSQICNRPSPVLVNGMIILINDTGIASCFDAKTGKSLWRKRIGGNYSASPLAASGYVYFGSHEGDVTTIAASAEYKEIAKSNVDGQIMASPAVVGNSMIWRTDTKLYRVK